MEIKSKYIYILECTGLYKIGYASKVESRLHSMQSGNPYEIKHIFSRKVWNPKDAESRLHKMLSEYKIKGEWFKLPKVLVYSIILDLKNYANQY
jgi:hypothetical protein